MSISMLIRGAYLILLIIGLSLTGQSQQSMQTFGKNRIQHKNFNWRFYSAENFDIYFYDGGRTMAKEAAEYLEEEFDKITDLIGYPPYSKTKIFLFNSIEDLQQSNVGIDDHTFDIGGETKFVKPYVEVANPGTVDGLKQEILLKVSQLLVDDMLFGGSLKDMFQNTYLLSLPDWFVLGVSEYLAKGWDEEMDDYVRELITSGKIKKLTRFEEEDAKVIGHSIWNYIAERYGRSNISNILNYTRIIRNEEKSITATLGISFKTLIEGWKVYYGNMNSQIQNNYVLPSADMALKKRNKKDYTYHQTKVSPDGQKLAYTQSKGGKYEVIVRSMASGDEVVALKGGYKVINQEVNNSLPVIDWSDDNTLGIINTKNGKLLFWLYDYSSKSKFSREINKLTNVESLSFSDNGRLAIVSADVNGKNDLYLLSTRRNRTKRLTHDVFDDITPSFVPGTNTIVFSSNRNSDTLNLKKDVELSEITDNYNLFYYDLDTTRNVLVRITNTLGKDFYPIAANPSEIYYLSDQKGIVNVYKYSLQSKIYNQVTNYQLSIREYDLNTSQSMLAFVMLNHQRENLYFNPEFDINANIFTPASARKQILQAKLLAQKRFESNEVKEEQDVIKQQSDLEKLFEADIAQQDTLTDIIDTDDYIFEEQILAEETNSFLSQYRNLRRKGDIKGPYPYEPRFSADNLVTSWVIDPLWGFGILLETSMNDMLENHKISGGALFTTDFRSGQVYADYQYLKYLIDYNIGFERKVISEEQVVLERYVKNEFEVGMSYPFDVRTRISLKPFIATTRYDNSEPFVQGGLNFNESIKQNYGGAKVEFVFDDSEVNELNSIIGTRGKISFKHYEGFSNSNKSFSNLSIDIRRNQIIHRELVIAGKAFFGTFFGNHPHQYMIGGMDNWLFNKSNTEQGSPLSFVKDAENSSQLLTKGEENTTLLFSEFVTSLRGFDYASLYGNHSLLFNFEMRFPIIRYFHSGPISSNFFRNLQLIGFYDIGSAWTGKSPFNKDNSISTVSDQQGQFKYEVKNFRNPWLSSYGVGARTVLLGYYLKFDLAWPVIDYDVKSPRLHITLGLDF